MPASYYLDSTRALGMAQVANRSSRGKLIRQTKMLFHHEDNLKRLSDPTEVAKLDPIHALLHWAPQGSVIRTELVPLLFGGYHLSIIASM